VGVSISGGFAVDEAMHAHGTSSVSHPGSFLKTVRGVRVDCELVSRREAIHAPWHL